MKSFSIIKIGVSVLMFIFSFLKCFKENFTLPDVNLGVVSKTYSYSMIEFLGQQGLLVVVLYFVIQMMNVLLAIMVISKNNSKSIELLSHVVFVTTIICFVLIIFLSKRTIRF